MKRLKHWAIAPAVLWLFSLLPFPVLAADDISIRELGKLLAAVKADPNDARSHFKLGVLYIEQGSLEEAVTEFKEAIRIEPKQAESHYNLGLLYGQTGQMEEAIHELIETVTLRPDDADAHQFLSALYQKKGLKQFAVREMGEAVRLSPNDIEARMTLADLMAEEDDLKGAIRQYQEVIQKDPNHYEARYNIGVLYGKRALRGTADSSGVIPLDALDFTDYAQLAIEQFEVALRIRPNETQAHYNLGLVYLYAGKIEKAHEEHGVLNGLDPSLGEKLSEKIKAVTSKEGAHVH